MTNTDTIAYEKFNLIEVKSEEGEKNYFIEGHISTIDPDSVKDITTNSCQDDLVVQTKTKDITMDLDHESFRNEDGTTPDRDLNKIPVAKIVESKRTAIGTYVKAMLNSSHPQFKNILSSIKNGFLHSFSIAYHVQEAVNKIIDGENFRLLNKVELRNVGITGNPVNSNATFSVSLKSYINKMEEKQDYSKLEEAIAEIKSTVDSLVNGLKSKEDEKVEAKSKEASDKLESLEAEVKSLTESVEVKDKELADLKSKLEEPVMTGAVEAEVKSEPAKNETRSFDTYI